MSVPTESRPSELEVLTNEFKLMRQKRDELLEIIKQKDAMIAKLSENQQKSHTIYTSKNSLKRVASDFPLLPTKNRFETLPIEDRTQNDTQHDDYDSDISTFSSNSTKRTKTTKQIRKTPQQNNTQQWNTEEAEMIEITEYQPENNPPTKTHTKPQSQNTKEDLANKEQETNSNKIPTIVLRTPERWTEIIKKLHNDKIGITRATAITDRIKIQTTTTADHRQITKYFAIISNTNYLW